MKLLAALMLVFSFLLPAGAKAAGEATSALLLPEDSTVFSMSFATQVIRFCQSDAKQLAAQGLEAVFQQHYAKDPMDASHTAGYTIYRGSVQYGGEVRTLMLVIVAPTTTPGEWYSNFDCVPSHSNTAQFAENFYVAAQDVYEGSKTVLSQAENPLIVVTGYSRGAACANLLGWMLTADYGAKNVFVYTVATPTTVRGEAAAVDCPNIFNVINPCDVITCMPPLDWGFRRLGQDIVLPGDERLMQEIQGAMKTLLVLAPDIESYYQLRHPLNAAAGDHAPALTVFEMMQQLVGLLGSSADAETVRTMTGMIPPDSDFAPLLALFTAPSNGSRHPLEQHMPAAYAQRIVQQQLQQAIPAE